ncbi:polar amino acid transport system permease protein [Gordonia amarae]|uniref:Putative amino acid ABC transporter permease protein n=1 Tax=Gordonia amarae NBRC 15530 TaxID=1075090 RepID=G7GSN4_9ACTN|nr:polar amino acid transport system permease protein [Gordonia amarae]GAB06609.1 putative amino acid ABC transporter permease protein [Gordonia amarae NBRC 15530]
MADLVKGSGAPDPTEPESPGTGPLATGAEPDPIKAVPLRHPGQWAAATVIIVLAALFVYGAATNDAYAWGTYGDYLFDTRILKGVGYTLALTVLSMVIAIVFGVVLAVMRLSPNRVLRSTSWVYLWIFRGTPVYVQLVFWGLFPSIYKQIDLGIPFTVQFAHFDIQDLNAAFTFAIIGLALNESAYMAEIVRAGVQSVGEGQTEASVALGMSWSQTMRRTVLPQAMRVIIPPTGNELISMLKTTSLVTAVPFSLEVYGAQKDIAGVIFEPIPLLLVASTWYLVVTSILMVGQFYLERYYAKGASRQLTARQLKALADAQSEAAKAETAAGSEGGAG